MLHWASGCDFNMDAQCLNSWVCLHANLFYEIFDDYVKSHDIHLRLYGNGNAISTAGLKYCKFKSANYLIFLTRSSHELLVQWKNEWINV